MYYFFAFLLTFFERGERERERSAVFTQRVVSDARTKKKKKKKKKKKTKHATKKKARGTQKISQFYYSWEVLLFISLVTSSKLVVNFSHHSESTTKRLFSHIKHSLLFLSSRDKKAERREEAYQRSSRAFLSSSSSSREDYARRKQRRF